MSERDVRTATRHAGRSPPDAGTLQVVSVSGAAAVPPTAWDALARRGFHRHGWFLAAEASARARPCHVTVSDGTELRLIVPAYFMDGDLYGDLHDRWLGPFATTAARLGVRLRPTINVTTPFARGADPFGDLDAVPDSGLDAVFELLEEQGRSLGARAVVWSCVGADNTRLLAAAERRGYRRVFAGSTARLHVRWSSFEEYLASRSRNARRRVCIDLRALARAGLRTERVTEFGPYAVAMSRLFQTAFTARNGHRPRLAPHYFATLADMAIPGLWAHLAFRGKALAGMSLNIDAAGVLDGGFAALAPECPTFAAYYNDLVYEPVRFACDRGIERIELGATALVPKVLRGATLDRRYMLVQALTPGTRLVVRVAGAVIDRRNEAKERRALARLRLVSGAYQ